MDDNDFDDGECLHTSNEVIEDLGNGYFMLRCHICEEVFVNG